MNKTNSKILDKEIEFINHASVILYGRKISLLSDPWYNGSAFHDGWNLIYENSDKDILSILKKITHIWISHEHPDHFSILFFKKYKELIKKNKIKILFQQTKDKRVLNFLNHLNLDTVELKNEKKYQLDDDFSIKCIKSGFYDSALIVELGDKKIFNLNDCPIETVEEIKEFNKKYGTCDLLLTQFSYAAWKGNKSNEQWAKNSALNKINIIKNQTKILKAKNVIPFASFIKFSHVENYHLNKNSNNPDIIIQNIGKDDANIVFLQPYEKQNLDHIKQDERSLIFWRNEISKSNNKELNKYENIIDLEQLNASFLKYKKRIFSNNSYVLIKILSLIPIIKPFRKVVIKLKDLNKSIVLNLFSNKIKITELPHDISLNSESLNFIFNNSFGFDTLTVNGCFEVGNKKGFEKITKLLAIENLNNLGINFNYLVFFNVKLFLIFLSRLKKVKKNLEI